MFLVFSFLFFLTLQGSAYAMKRTTPDTPINKVSAGSNETSIENFSFDQAFLPYWANTLKNKRYTPLSMDDVSQFNDLQETAELTGRILPINKKSSSTLNIPFKDFLKNIRIFSEGVLNEKGEFDGKSFIDVFYNQGIPSRKIFKQYPDDIQFNFDNQLDRIQINIGHDTDGDLLPPLRIKRFLLKHIVIADGLSQDISNPENLADIQNECMGDEAGTGGPNNEAQGNIMPYLFSYATFLQASDKNALNVSNQNVIKTRNWIIQFFKKILYVADKNSVVFTDRFTDKNKDKRIFYILPEEKNDSVKYIVRAENNVLTLCKKN